MTAKQETYYVVYIEKHGQIYYLSHFNDWTGDYDLGDRPFKFTNKDYAKALADSKNFILDQNNQEARFGLRKIVEKIEEITVQFPRKPKPSTTVPTPDIDTFVEIEE